MATPLDDIEYQQVIDAWLETGKSLTQGAERLGMNYNTFKSRMKTAKAMGLHTARAQLQAITIHRHLGEIQRVKVAA